MSKGDELDVQKTYAATAAWLRDCVKRGDQEAAAKAGHKLKELDAVLATKFGEA
ncbi:MAG: hypothetical protein ABSD42_06830 [Candidatus Bathyarchaeia archaeon]|jgi:hypothetical protein